MPRWLIGLVVGLVGLAVGLAVGVAVVDGASTEAAWGFLGVIVGAGTTIVIEEIRASRSQKQRLGEWKLGKLDRMSEAVSEVERSYKLAYMWQATLLAKTKILPPSHLNAHVNDLESAIHLLRMSAGAFPGDDMYTKANAYWSKTYDVVVYEPDYADEGSILDDPTVDRLIDDLADQSGERVKRLKDLMTAMDEATASALDESG